MIKNYVTTNFEEIIFGLTENCKFQQTCQSIALQGKG